MKPKLIVAAVCSTVLVAGCAWIAPVKDTSRFFVLRAQPVVETYRSIPAPLRQEILVGVGPVRLPNYLKQPEIVEALIGSEVRYSQTDRWAEPLDATTGTVIAQDLSALLGVPGITAYPWAAGVLPGYSVPMRVIRFENDGAGTVHLEVRWAIRDAKAGRVVHVADFRTSTRAPTPDTNGTVAAMSAALTEFSQEIAVAVRQVLPQ
jgi:uncharacterized lipoprotein YmbA